MSSDTDTFQQHRSRLFGLAYRMLGVPADAEDVLHDAWLRWQAHDVATLDDPEAWLVTVTTRIALDRLRRARTEREHYSGPWLPEPMGESPNSPHAELESSETLTLSFLLLLERLSPDERAAFLLHDVFDYSHAEASAILDIEEDACRQRVHRAKARLREGRPRFHVDAPAQRRLLQRFVEAMHQPSEATMRALFTEDAVHVADGGGLARATLHPLHGAERLARLYLQLARQARNVELRYELRTLNGAPALLCWRDRQLFYAMWIDCDGERITSIHTIRHPGKLARIEAVTKHEGGASLH
ncbi:MAG TPA: RNA polymerase sigma factor SigJ [Rhodanobacteraceae bacterium]|nr:RNA polymerase sigma factor SigJ [Rhodanobacteraceae bacterium]